ncbi:hypothetical protein PS1_045829 [Malus domestica]
MKLSKRCECGAILQFEGMFCLGVAGADQLPYKMDLLLRCNNGLNYQWIISQWKCHAKVAAEDITGPKLEFPWQRSVYRHSEECSFILFLACKISSQFFAET